MARYVLIHGSWHGAWCWRDVERRLRQAGHDVYTPTLSGCAERYHHCADKVTLSTHVRDVTDLLFFEDITDVVLVAHSYAGIVAQAVGNLSPERIASIVYLDAYIVQPGGRGYDLWTAERRAEAADSIAAGYPFRKPFTPAFLGVADQETAAWVAARLTPHPLATYDEIVPPESESARRIPRVYVQCTAGEIAPIFAPIVDSVRARGWRIEQLDAPHDAMLTHPAAVAGLLLNAAGPAAA